MFKPEVAKRSLARHGDREQPQPKGGVTDCVIVLVNRAIPHKSTPKTLQADPEPLYRYVGVRR